jgi:hypothetical protein
MEIEGIEAVFEVANNYIIKKKLEICELEKQADAKKNKVKKIQMALIIIEENCRTNN